MVKRQKLESQLDATSLAERISVEEESLIEKPDSDFSREAQIEETSGLEDREPSKESLAGEEPQNQVFEKVNSNSNPSVAFPTFDGADSIGTDVENNDPASMEKLLEPFSKEQLVQILLDACLKHHDLLESIRQTADSDPAHRKIFVYGLGWSTTAETLIDAFRQYGEIDDCKAVMDKSTGRSKGYGFILFKHRSAASRALKEPQKLIGGRMASCQLASVGPPPATAPALNPVLPLTLPMSEYTQRKIYVSNVGEDLDPQKVLQFFSKYGEIVEGPLGLDKVTGKPRGFCLFVYKSTESAKKALEEPHKNFEGHILHCQKAIDGPKPVKAGIHLSHEIVQYSGMYQSPNAFGARGSHFGKSDGSVSMGGFSSSIVGPGHLIAPPAINMGLNQAGLAVSNIVHSTMPAFGNDRGGAGVYLKHGVVGGYGSSPQLLGNYGGAGSAKTQQGPGHVGGVGPYMGQ